MRLIKPSFELWDQGSGLEGIYEQIEKAGRICYKSEDKITKDSAIEFVNKMIKLKHGAMLEHGTIYLDLPNSARNFDAIPEYSINKYSKMKTVIGDDRVHNYVTTNLRVIVENDWVNDLQYLCEPTEYHEKRITVKFICDRGVSHEFVRHRVFSFAQESTRYCNYSKDKFQGITFIQPSWLDGDISNKDGSKFDDVYVGIYLNSLIISENAYLDLLKQWDEKVPDKRFKSGFRNNPWTPQQARAVLPNSLKTELVMTGFVSDWGHFFNLRDAKSAHPQAYELAHPLHMEFISKRILSKFN